MDETYVRVKGQWTYLYRAVDKQGQTIDSYLSLKRDVNAAKVFLRKAINHQRVPTKITLDAYAASHRAVADLKQSGELPKRVEVRSSKYLNNIVEIVFTQMTKPNTLTAPMGGNYVTDLDFAVGHKDAVN